MSGDTPLGPGQHPTEPVALDLQDAAIRFGARHGLRDITLSVARGERLALMGASGAGKTTLLRAIAGLECFESGRLYINGIDVASAPPEQRRCVYLHQTPALFPHMSVLDNVAFPLVLRGQTQREARAHARTLLEPLRLASLSDRSPARLSGGERQRTALARALAAQPVLLLLDEPFAALDPSLRAEVREQVLATLATPGAPAVVVVTHDVDEAAQMGTRLAVMIDGRMPQHDRVDEVLRRPVSLAAARLLGVPNLVPGYHDGRSWSSRIGSAPVAGIEGPAWAVGWTDMVRLCSLADGDQQNGRVQGIVASVEHRGLGRVARVRVDEHELLARVDADASWQSGDRVAVALEPRAIHLITDRHDHEPRAVLDV